MDWSKVDKALSEAVVSPETTDGASPSRKGMVAPGAVLLVGRGGDVLYHKAFGCRSLEPEVTPMRPDTVCG